MELSTEVITGLTFLSDVSDAAFTAITSTATKSLTTEDATLDVRTDPAITSHSPPLDPVALHNSYSAVCILILEGAKTNASPDVFSIALESAVPSLSEARSASLRALAAESLPQLRAALCKTGFQLPVLKDVRWRLDQTKSQTGPDGAPGSPAEPLFKVGFQLDQQQGRVSTEKEFVVRFTAMELADMASRLRDAVTQASRSVDAG
eukprot:TRINITY_DN33581_c0_g1_i1.p1 TRINITY_DN33581_c0_g1~~TRINITY_DN33581_c0_g1_i1.p1  ORF type:complete len:206 (-),score=24.90 TRINITY_DN33581_c0_g1_i1:98-715(-)